ncbi:MAG: hypothetical protein ACRDSP_24400 [Pseudonocardiaceae bacterium]
MEELAKKIGEGKPMAPEVLEELVIRLLTSAVMLLRQHVVNKRGQCKFCEWTRWTWRFWRRRRRCTVFQALDYAMGQGLEVAWWQLLSSIGNAASLEEVREWLSDKRTVE